MNGLGREAVARGRCGSPFDQTIRIERAVDGGGDLGARIELREARRQRRGRGRIGKIGLRHDQAIRQHHLLARLRRPVEGFPARHRVDDRKRDLGVELGAERAVGRKRLQDRAGVGEAAGLDDDAAERRQQTAVAFGDEPAQRHLQVAARDAAGAAVAEQHRRLGAVAHQRIVDADRAELVDDDGGAAPLRAREERAHQSGLPGAEEAGDDGDRNAAAARVLHPAPERPGSAGGEEVERVVHLC